MPENEGQWVSVDEAEDVAGSIRHALRAAIFAQEDPQAWKWVLLALHSALQGACVCHLTTTAAPIGAVTERNAGEWIDYFAALRDDPTVKQPKTYLMALPDLLKAIRKPHSAGDRSNETGVTLSDAELAWLRRIHDEVRNQFVHFEPMGWSLEVSGVPAIGQLIARILREMLDMGWAFRHLEREARAALRADLETLSSTGWAPGPNDDQTTRVS